MWYDPETKQLARSHAEARALRPNWGAPSFLTEEMLASAGFLIVTPTAAEYDPVTQVAVELAPVFLDGAWTQVWRVDALPAATIADALAQAKEAAIAKCFVDVDAIYDLAVGRRVTEYEKAEVAARTYVAAGYTGTPKNFGYVTGYAKSNPTGGAQSDRWAADQIIARADAFSVAELLMRDTRFTRQAGMREAANMAQLSVVKGQWNAFIAGVRAQLGL